jgi:hypothetical protein
VEDLARMGKIKACQIARQNRLSSSECSNTTSGEQYDVVCDGRHVGRIYLADRTTSTASTCTGASSSGPRPARIT